MLATVPAVHCDPDILGGTPVFVGTRVPFRNLIDYLERNHSWTSSSTPSRRCHGSRPSPPSKRLTRL